MEEVYKNELDIMRFKYNNGQFWDYISLSSITAPENVHKYMLE